MTGPEPETNDSDDPKDAEVPPVAPAYSTPPPEGTPDADNP